MIKLPNQIERLVIDETKKIKDKELILPKYEFSNEISIPVGLYYWQKGDEIDYFPWNILNVKSELQLEKLLHPLTRYRVKKLIKSFFLGREYISFATYFFICKKLQQDLYFKLNPPVKLDNILNQFNGFDNYGE